MSIAIQTSQYHDQSNETWCFTGPPSFATRCCELTGVFSFILPDARFLCVPCFFLNFTKALFFASALTCR